MTETDKMKCPDCGAGMNHHADKLVREGAGEEESSEEEPGEVVLEAHTCPACGLNATRPRAAEPAAGG